MFLIRMDGKREDHFYAPSVCTSKRFLTLSDRWKGKPSEDRSLI